VTRIACPAVAFKAEAIVAPTKLLPTSGRGAHTGKVSDLAYHNSLMVQIWSMLASGTSAGCACAAAGCRPSRQPRPG
jgi:amylosucrase